MDQLVERVHEKPTREKAPDPEDAASTTLELDELWSFVLKKVKQVWVWGCMKKL